jgi:hypothetical protein
MTLWRLAAVGDVHLVRADQALQISLDTVFAIALAGILQLQVRRLARMSSKRQRDDVIEDHRLTGVRIGIIAGVVAACAAPSAAINVWPKIAEMWAASAADHNRVGMALFWCAVSALMALCPIAFESQPQWPSAPYSRV